MHKVLTQTVKALRQLSEPWFGLIRYLEAIDVKCEYKYEMYGEYKLANTIVRYTLLDSVQVRGTLHC